MINTYGLHWSRKKVEWGERGRERGGELLGYRKSGGKPVDFKDQRGIYALYHDFDLVEIGQTGAGNNRLLARLRSHQSDHLALRWNRFSWFGTKRVKKKNKLSIDTDAAHPKTDRILDVLEAVAIAMAEPRLNLQRGNWGDTEQFFQKRSLKV